MKTRDRLKFYLRAFWGMALALAFAVEGKAASLVPERPVIDSAKGYIESLDQEEELGKDIEISVPKSITLQQDTVVNDKIFTTQLATEFQSRYEQTFGRTAAEQLYNFQSNPYEYQGNGAYGFQMTDVERRNTQRSFGEYMGRRLVEFHVDNYIRNEPKARQIYEIKEKISKVKVEVSPGYSFNAQYSFSGNYVDAIFDNPIARFAARIENRDTTLTLQRAFTSTITAEEYYTIIDGVQKVVVRKRLSPALDGTFLISTFVTDGGYTPRESLYLAGLHYIF